MENKIIITKDAFIKVRSVENNVIIGYNIFTEELVQISNSDYMEITSEIISILGDEEKRIRLANAMCKNQIGISKILKVSERTVFRLENEFMNSETLTIGRRNYSCKK